MCSVVHQGYNFEKVDKIKEEFLKIRKQHCLNCDINHLCGPCFVYFMDDGFFSLDEDICRGLREWHLKLLQREIYINERIADYYCTGIFKFHQFVHVFEGPVNAAIIDLLKGDIYQVPTKTVKLFRAGEFESIGEFVSEAEKLDLVIKVNQKTWIPKTDSWEKRISDELKTVDYVLLHLESRIDAKCIAKMVKKFRIVSIKYYGNDNIDDIALDIKISYSKKDYDACKKNTTISDGCFQKIEQASYQFNKICNTCWGHKIAITKDGKLRPCIFSNIIIADIEEIDKIETIEKIKSYWFITKDRVERCKECEFRYVCFDCREIAQRKNNGNLFASNPHCNYNPFTGQWEI